MPAFPQDVNGSPNYATVRGTVTAADRRPVARAQVIAYSSAGVQTATTDRNGHYYLMALMPGTYYIRAYRIESRSWTGRERLCRDDNPVELDAGFIYRADFKLDSNCVYEMAPIAAETR